MLNFAKLSICGHFTHYFKPHRNMFTHWSMQLQKVRVNKLEEKH